MGPNYSNNPLIVWTVKLHRDSHICYKLLKIQIQFEFGLGPVSIRTKSVKIKTCVLFPVIRRMSQSQQDQAKPHLILVPKSYQKQKEFSTSSILWPEISM
jgi:hypothetical protein